MATTYPGAVQTFPVMQDISPYDGPLVLQYQLAMRAGNLSEAQRVLAQIIDADSKIVNADYLNTINDTLVALQTYFTQKYSPAYVVSNTQPQVQEDGDYWFDTSNN